MANKSFEIQESKLRIGGVDLEAGAAGGVVIPGVTQASNYRVEEVEDAEDQTYQFAADSEVVVLDAALYNAIVNELANDHFADYTAPTDGEGYIDGIEVNGRGTYTSAESSTAGGNNMYAYVGAGSASDRPLVPQDWIQIPFRPKMRAGAVENVSGGSGSSIINEGERLSIRGDGEVVLDGPEGGINRGVRWQYGSDNGGYDSFIRQDMFGFTIQSYADEENPDGTNITLRTGDSNNIWKFQPDGALRFPDGSTQTTAGGGNGLAPQLTKVDNKIQLKGTLEMDTNPGGSVSTLDSDQSTAVWFNSATGDSNGNKYAVGNDENGNSFLVSYNPDGSLRWKYTFDNINYGEGNYQVMPYTIKRFVGEGELIYVGFDFYNFTGAVAFSTDGTIINSWTWTVDGGASLDHRALVIDPSTGNPIIAGRTYGEWNSFNNVPVDQGLIDDGVLSINRSDLNNVADVYPWSTSNWNIDIDGTTNWYMPAKLNAFVAVPLTTVTGVGGYRSLTGGIGQIWSFDDGALTVDNSGVNPILTITAANWRATADLNAILVHGIGQTYNLVLNVSDTYIFQTTHSWTETDPGVSGVWTVEGTLTLLGGGPISTAVNVTNISYGTTTLVNVYYNINSDGTSSYNSVEVHTVGTGYGQGDQVMIPGVSLGGTNLTSTTVSSWVTQGGPYSLSLIYDKSSHPDLGTTVQAGWLASGGGLYNAVVTSITEYNYNDTTPVWSINLNVAASNYDGSSDVTYNNGGNDLAMTYYWDWNYLQINSGLPIQNTVRFLMDQPLTGTSFNIRQSTGDQGFIVTSNWTMTLGDGNDQEIHSISLDSVNNILYATGDFNTPGQNDYPVIAIDSTNGEILWQKSFDDGSSWVGSVTLVADGANNCVYVPFENDYGQSCVMKLDLDGNLVWSVKFQNNNWNYYPQGAIDSNGDLVLVGTYNIYNPTFDQWSNELFFTKLSKTDGSQLWANSLTRNISQRNDIYFNYDVDNNWLNIVNDVVYAGGYTYDANNNYNVGLAVGVAADGSGLGDYDGWNYHSYDSLGINDITGDMTFSNTDYQPINQLAMELNQFSYSLTSDQPSWSTYSTAIGGGSKVKFEDGSEQSTAGISRHSKDGGGTSKTLSASMNGKFLYYDNSNNNSNTWLYIPSNADVELPIGFTVTVIVGNLNGYSIYVNNNGNSDVVIYHAGSSDGVNSYWMFASDGYPGIYTIMKVDTNTWMLAGPNIQVD